MSINPYNNGYNKFDYTIDELDYIDDSWNLIDKFSTSYLTKSELREKIILFVSESYTPHEFEKLEIIIEKMYWNMIYILKKILRSSYIDQKIFVKKTNNINKQIRKIYLKNRNLSESYINKILVNKNDYIYYKYDYPNSFDIIISSIISNRSIYETIYNKIDALNINLIKKLTSGINIRENFDYLFPNINSIIPFCYNNRMKRLEKYYYEKNSSDSNWFIFL